MLALATSSIKTEYVEPHVTELRSKLTCLSSSYFNSMGTRACHDHVWTEVVQSRWKLLRFRLTLLADYHKSHKWIKMTSVNVVFLCFRTSHERLNPGKIRNSSSCINLLFRTLYHDNYGYSIFTFWGQSRCGWSEKWIITQHLESIRLLYRAVCDLVP